MRPLSEVSLLRAEPVPSSTFTRAELAAAPGLGASVAPVVDWQTVVALRRTASALIASRTAEAARESVAPLTALDRRLLGRSVVLAVVAEHAARLGAGGSALWPAETEQAYAQALESAIFGYGRLQPLFEIPTAENIEIQGSDPVVVQYADGRRQELPPVADTDEELVDAVRFLGESASPARPFDDAHPTMTLALGSRFRLHALGFGLSHRPSVAIRQHTLTTVRLPELVAGGMLTEDLARLLHAAVLARKSLVISGDQGAGKTTLLRALVAAIPANERFGTIETDYELLTHLQPGRRNVVALQARIGLGETQDGRRLGQFSVADLIPEALRQNLARLVVGEVRGDEAGAMFEAMLAGAGTMSTTHSHSAASTIDRLASRVAQGGVISVEEAYRQIAHHVHLLIHVRLTDDTWRGGRRTRIISEVRQLTGGQEAGRPVTHLVYQADPAGGIPRFTPDPAFLAELEPYESGWQG